LFSIRSALTCSLLTPRNWPARLRAELARVTMERDQLGKATAYFAKVQR
jgi:transposase-like protein